MLYVKYNICQNIVLVLSLILHKRDNSKCIFFVFALNNTSWLSFHVGRYKFTSFFAICYYKVWLQHNLFDQFTVDGYSGCFPFFTTVNNDVIPMYINHGTHVNRFIAQIGGNSTAGISIFNLDTFCQNISKKNCTDLHSH